MMNVKCPNCNKKIDDSFINLRSLLADCQRCGTNFSLSPAFISTYHKPHLDLKKPFDMELEKQKEKVVFSWRESSCLDWIMMPIAIAWLLFPLGFIIQQIDAEGFSTFTVTELLMVSLFLLIGLFLICSSLLRLMTTIRIELTHDSLSVLYSPFGIVRSQTVPRSDIFQLYTSESYRTGFIGPSSFVKQYSVYLLRFEGENGRLISNLSDKKKALFLEQEIENFYNIPNRRVQDEIEV